MFKAKNLRISMALLAAAILLIAGRAISDRATASSPEVQEDKPVLKLYFIVRTWSDRVTSPLSDETDSGTDSDLLFRVKRSDGTVWEQYAPEMDWDENEYGRAETYIFPSGPNDPPLDLYVSDFLARRVCIQVVGDDAWLPEYIFVLGVVAGDGAPVQLLNWGRDMPQHQWTSHWWMSGEPEASEYDFDLGAVPSRNLNGVPCEF